ncbi:MAG: rimO 1 [Firmicutes bacterium]|nr:rimO 1 [Bacillota bacterium]
MIKLDPSFMGKVIKPGRYTGNELNIVRKDPATTLASFALAFPDVYDVGMSNLGLKILYHILNQMSDVAAERVYAPWVDMELVMRQEGIPLYTLENMRPLAEFDVVGFTLQYELSYTNILNMLDLADIPLLASQRSAQHSLVIAGGPCAFNAEPLADFVDFFVLGDGEETIKDVAHAVIEWKRSGKAGGKAEILARVAAIEGVYVPAFYDPIYHADGRMAAVTANHPAAKTPVNKRIVRDLDGAEYPNKPVVPYLDVIHDRVMLELFRGCTRGCRFCQAGVIYRPVRERQPQTLLKLAQELVDNTGYDEISLTSLSSADYSCLNNLVESLIERFKNQGVSVSLPSLRVDSFSIKLAQEVQKVRKSGLTFAPEAGTQRLRDVINKGVTEKNLEEAVGAAFQAGWSTVKLYFMIGLPTETDDDVRGIADIAYKVLDLYKTIKGRRGAKVTVSVSSFVPKPHTAFQWYAQNDMVEIERKQQLLRSLLRDRNISFNWHDVKVSFLEGVFARGDRRLGKVLLSAWQQGAKFDGWSEHFRFDVWQEAFRQSGIDPAFYALRDREHNEVLPWDHLSSGVDKEFLLQEYRAALAGGLTVDCRRGMCGDCGVCSGLGVEVIDWGEGRNDKVTTGDY